jgi:hypothetical protein
MYDDYFVIPEAKIVDTRGRVLVVRTPMFDRYVNINSDEVLDSSPVATINDAENEMWVTIKFARKRKWIK